MKRVQLKISLKANTGRFKACWAYKAKTSIRIWKLAGWLLFSLSLIFAQQLEIHHINVGQADASLIVSPTGTTMLIDGGNTSDGTNIIYPYLTSLGITRLNYVVCSHYHGDHMGGLDEVINNLGVANVDTIYDRGRDAPLPTTTSFNEYESAANATGRRKTVELGQIINLGDGVMIKCLASDGEIFNYGAVNNATKSENDLSIGWRLSYGSFQYFTGGDLGGDTTYYADNETPLAAQIGDVDAMKINHHGSRYSTNQTFLDSLKPEVAFIAVGDSNSYGHPTQAVLNRLAAANCYIYQTEKGTGGTIPAGKGAIAGTHVILKTTGLDFTVSYGRTTVTYPGDAYTAIDMAAYEIPQIFFLAQNYPNPFNPATTLKFVLPKKNMVHLAIYDLLGREVQTLIENEIEAGFHEVCFDAASLPSGVYFYRLQAGELHTVKKCLLVR